MAITKAHFVHELYKYRSLLEEEGDEYIGVRSDFEHDIAVAAGMDPDSEEVAEAVQAIIEETTVWYSEMVMENSIGEPEIFRLLRLENGSLALTLDAANELFKVLAMGDDVDYESIVQELYESIESCYDEEVGLIGGLTFYPSGGELEAGEFHPTTEFEFLNSVYELDKLRSFFPEAGPGLSRLDLS